MSYNSNGVLYSNKMEKLKITRSLVLDGQIFDKNMDDAKVPAAWDSQGIITLKQTSETADALYDLNADKKESETRMYSVDQRARLNTDQFKGTTKLDVLTTMQVIPSRAHALSHQAKRNSISLEGKGRDEQIRMAAGVADKNAQKGLMAKLGGMFKRKDETGGAV